MKKVYVYAVAVLALFIFACTIPTSIEIKGTPKIKFAANRDLGGEFSALLNGFFDSGGDENGFKVLDCVNAPLYRTFLIRMEIINEKLKFDFKNTGQPLPEKIIVGGKEYEISHLFDTVQQIKLEEKVTLVKDDPQEPMKIDFSGLSEHLMGFGFDKNSVKAKLFISGSEIVKSVNIDFFLGDQETNISGIELGTSGIDITGSEYTGKSLPAGGKDINNIVSLLNSKEEIEVKYDVEMPKGTIINVHDMDKVDIAVELVVWIPLYFEAVGTAETPDKASLAFPGDFMSGVSGFIDSIAEVVDSLSLVVELNDNPFKEGTLVLEDKNNGIRMENSLGDTFLNFSISEEDLKNIINADSFKPGFYIEFVKGKHLEIPRELKLLTISLEAKLHYNIDFKGDEE